MDYRVDFVRLCIAVLLALPLLYKRSECRSSAQNDRLALPEFNQYLAPWKNVERKFPFKNQSNHFNGRKDVVRNSRNSIPLDFKLPANVVPSILNGRKYKTLTKDTRRAVKSYLKLPKADLPVPAPRIDSKDNQERNETFLSENPLVLDEDSVLSVQNASGWREAPSNNLSEASESVNNSKTDSEAPLQKDVTNTYHHLVSTMSPSSAKVNLTTMISQSSTTMNSSTWEANTISPKNGNSTEKTFLWTNSTVADFVDYRMLSKNVSSDVSIITLDTQVVGGTLNLTTSTSVISNGNLSVEASDNYTNATLEWIDEAKDVWGIAWDLYIYPIAALFILLAITSCIMLVNHFVAMCEDRTTFLLVYALLLVIGSSRSFWLLYDPYSFDKNLSPVLGQVLYDLTYPCLMSAFAMTFSTLTKTTNYYSKSLFFIKTRNLVMIISIHIVTIVITDVIFDQSGTYCAILFLVSHCLCSVWILVLLLSVFHVYHHLHLAAIRKQGEIIRATFTKLHIEGAPLPSKFPRPYLALAVRFLLLFSVLGIFLTIYSIFGIVLTSGLVSRRLLSFWPWWSFQFTSRLLELVLSALLMAVISHLYNYQESCVSNRNTQSSLFSRIFQRTLRACMIRNDIVVGGDDIYPTYHVSNAAVARTHFTFERWDASLPVTFCNPDVSTPSLHPTTSRNVATMFSSAPSEGTNVSSLSSRYVLSSSLSNASECYRSLGSKRQSMRATMSPLSDVHSRPPSMLFNENGFIRFRDAGDPEQPMVMTDEEGLPEAERVSLTCEGGKLECHVDGMRKMIRGSQETDVSSGDQWSTCGNNRFGIGTLRRYGSTCSSESASTSFDVHLFLHPPPLSGTKTMKLCHRRSVNTTPSKEVCNVGVGNRVSTGSGTFTRPPAPPHLNLTPNSRKTPVLPEGQNMQDITPDSAVFLELPTPSDKEKSISGGILITNFPRSQNQQDLTFSQSLNDLQCETPNLLTPKHRGRSRSLLSRLKGSTFSLASHQGYEPLDSRVSPQTTIGRSNKLWRTNSEDPSVLNVNLGQPRDFRQWEMRTVFRDSGASSRMSRERRRDSFYDSEISSTTGSRDMIHYVDMEVQTDPVDFSQPKTITADQSVLKIPEDATALKTPSPILVAEQESTL